MKIHEQPPHNVLNMPPDVRAACRCTAVRGCSLRALLPNNGVVALCGAGGKTSLMFALAQEAIALQKQVLCTTTTKMYEPQLRKKTSLRAVSPPCDALYLLEHDVDAMNLQIHDTANRVRESINAYPPSVVVVAANRLAGGKLLGLSPQMVDALAAALPEWIILVEADGAAHRAVKVPSLTEPVFPASTRTAIAVVGLDALGKPMNEHTVHRVDRLLALTGYAPGTVCSVAILKQLATAPKGWFNGCPASADRYVFGNKADSFLVPAQWPWLFGSASEGWMMQEGWQ